MKCVICGKEIEKSEYSSKVLCSSECFHIDFWRDCLDDEAVIVNKICYHVGKEHSKSPFRGHSGAKFKIRMKETGKVIETTNLWHNGEVPDEFYKGDNAEFLPIREKVSVVGREFDCRP